MAGDGPTDDREAGVKSLVLAPPPALPGELDAGLPVAAAADRRDEPMEWAERLSALAPHVHGAGLRIVLGVPGDDVHVVANQLAEAILATIGYQVTNLGVLVSTAEFVRAAREVDASALVLSSLNGHALRNCGPLPSALESAGLEVPVYVGGNVTVGRPAWGSIARGFRALGFAGVFPPRVSLPEGIAHISTDLLQRLSGGPPLKALG